ncbi:MAG: hypothetical protein CMJ64_03465 [Planctomycetaceae bacterium]|jgi:predicted NAD/FAD-dependent oxidoreductase|nr:hypothetical protein [Planctomycetaceae bacterium]
MNFERSGDLRLDSFAKLPLRWHVRPAFPQLVLLPRPDWLQVHSWRLSINRYGNELAARIESDPEAVLFVTTKACQRGWTAVAVISAFVCGFAIGSWFFH